MRLRVYSLSPRKEREKRWLWKRCALYHSSLLVLLLLLAATGHLGAFALIAFAPALGRAFWTMFKPAVRLNLKRVGTFELVYSMIFLVFVTLSFSGAGL